MQDVMTEKTGEQLDKSCTMLSPATPFPLEILTVEEFAVKMKVCETTVWKWIRNGKLLPGRHFIQLDRIIRFHWSVSLIDRLHTDCYCQTSEPTQQVYEDVSHDSKKMRYGKRINFEM